MKLFTGWVMSAGLVLAATSANAQMLAPYQIGGPRYSAVSDFDGPYAEMPPEVPGAPLRPDAAAGAGSLHGRPRERLFAAWNSAATRLLLHDFGDQSRRRRRPVGDRCPQRADRPLRAGVPNGRQYQSGYEHDLRPGRAVATGEPGQGRPAAPGADPAAGEPHARRAAAPRDAAASRRAEAAGGDAGAGAGQQQSAAIQPKPPEAAPAPSTVGAAAIAAKPSAPQIRPTQEMPKVQDLE